jgi:hypothetical protein
MILTTATTVVERSGTTQEHAFTIKATASAFQILSSGLYSDKILAIIRELSANAYDSHVAAGKKHVPIEVKLPSTFDATFYVKDFGIGLSHEQVISLYSTYFDSTKQDSNDFIGALGLGSKSPFSYTTAFNVESRYDGIRHVYSCFINENQLPSIVKLSEVAMVPGEENGMTISLSAKQDDFSRFETAAKKTYMYYDPLPEIVGRSTFAPYSLSHTVVGSNWKIRHSDYYASMYGPHVVQGFITYPIDRSAITAQGLSVTAQALVDVAIDFTVPIGQVEVAASREALSYSKQTTSNIVNIFEVAATEIYESFQVAFDKCSSLWEVGLLFEELTTSPSKEFNELFLKFDKSQPFTWKGHIVRDKIRIDLSNITYTKIQQFSVINGGSRISMNRDWLPGRGSDSFDIPIGKNVRVMVDDTFVATREVCRKYINSFSVGKITLIVIKPIIKKHKNQLELDRILESIGIEEYVLASDCVDSVDVKPRSKPIKREKTERLVWTPVETVDRYYQYPTHGKNHWDLDSIDISAGGYYVAVNRYTPYYNNQPYTVFKDLIKYSTLIGLIPKGTPIYGLPIAEVAKLGTGSQWINVVDMLKTQFEQFLLDTNDGINACYEVTDFKSKIGATTHHVLCSYHDTKSPWTFVGDFNTFWDNVVRITNTAQSINRDHVNKVANVFQIKLNSYTSTNSLYEQWTKLKDTYSMLSFVEDGGLDTEDDVQKLVTYINLVDLPSIDI